MSSRVRLMLQDFNNGTSHTGKVAYQHLQDLYKNWERARGVDKTHLQETWIKVTDEFAHAHPFSVTSWHREPTRTEASRPIQWDGPGFYQTKLISVLVPAKPEPAQALPTGPKWLQALEMWTRMQATHGANYKFFISRDNRKHAWRKSLCNPFYQQFAWKARKPVAAKKAGKKDPVDRRVFYGEAWRDTEHRFEIPAAPRGTRNAQTGEQKPAAVKPRVGIWS